MKLLRFALCAFFVASLVYAQRTEPQYVANAVGNQYDDPIPVFVSTEQIALIATFAAADIERSERMEELKRWNEEGRLPAKNGFVRPLSTPLQVRLGGMTAMGSAPGQVRRTASGTTVWSGAIEVEDADRIRLELSSLRLPEGARLWIKGSGGEEVGFGTELIDAGGVLYTPSVAGGVAVLVIELPADSETEFRISGVVELTDTFPKSTIGSDVTPACLVDSTCVTSGTLDVIDPYRRAVAYLQFMSGGSSAVCTGALMNDTDDSTDVPYLLTANHCISTSATASSLELFWDYRSATCNGPAPSGSTLPRSSGAQLLATSASTDFTFLRLNSIPANRVFLGWDPRASSVSPGTRIHRLSHPLGEPLKYSAATIDGTFSACGPLPRSSFLYSATTTGGTYGGSSGAPTILSGGYVVGQLNGGCGPDPAEGCDTRNRDTDGAFSATFPAIASYLAGEPSGTQPCSPSATTACLLNNRFRVTVRYRGGFDNNAADTSAKVKSVTGFANPSFETAFFYFNSDSNIEMMIKMLDQGNQNSQGQPTIALLFGTATPLRIELNVTDTTTGVSRNYTSEFAAMKGTTDFNAFVK